MHQDACGISVANQVYEKVEDLRVQDGRRFKVLASRGGSGEDENARADDGADAEGCERPRAERFFQPMLGLVRLRNEPVNGFAGQQLTAGPALHVGGVFGRLRQWLLALHHAAMPGLRLSPAAKRN